MPRMPCVRRLPGEPAALPSALSPPAELRRGQRRAVVQTLAGVLLLSALPISAQARVAIATAINRTARFRALSQRIAKAYAQLHLGVMPDRAREALTAARTLVQAGFDDMGGQTWPAELAAQLAETRQHAERLDALVSRPPSKEGVASVSAWANRMLAAADAATQSLERLAQAGTAKLVNTAGRQRMLSQRLAKNYNLAAAGFDGKELQGQMAADASEFRRALAALGAAPISTPAIRAELAQGEAQWLFFDNALQHAAEPRRLEAVATTSERLLEVTDRLTALYEAALRDVLG